MRRTLDMKILKEEFETFAQEQGFENGVEIFEILGYSEEEALEYIEGREPIDRELLLAMYDEFGTSDVIDFVEFGSGYEWEWNLDLMDEI